MNRKFKRAEVKKRPEKPDYSYSKDGVSATFLIDFIACKEKARIALERWKPVRQAGPAQFGSLAHDVLQRVYSHRQKKGLTTGKPPRKLVLAFIHDAVEHQQDKYGALWTDKELDQLFLHEAQLQAVLPAYFDYWEDNFDWVSLEEWFQIPFHGTKLKGRMDAAFRRGGELWNWETKTMGRIDEEAISETLERDFQSLFYRLVLKLQTNQYPAGTYYNVLRRPGLEFTKRDGTLENHSQRVADHIKGDPEHYFKRFEVAMAPRELNEFEAELRSLLDEFKLWCVAGFPTRKFGMPCVGKFGLCWNVPICYHNNLQNFIQIGRKK